MIEEGMSIRGIWEMPIYQQNAFPILVREQGENHHTAIAYQHNLLHIHPPNAIIPQQSQPQQLQLETNIYDFALTPSLLIASNRAMPLRAYRLPTPHNEQQPIASISTQRPNTQAHSSPISLALSSTHTFVGGGKKLMAKYDLNRFVRTVRYKPADKLYVSAIDVTGEDTGVLGQFGGEVSLFDLRSQSPISAMRPHVDMVSRLGVVPGRPEQFVSVARKDNYSYLWDVRNLCTFIHAYHHPRHLNQRTALALTPTLALLGGEQGQIYAHSLTTGQLLAEWRATHDSCISSICVNHNSHLLFTQGSRLFDKEVQVGGVLGACLLQQ